MRKINRIIMISVSVLLSLVLITSSVLSGTFAKYVTGEKSVSSNTGTVASWGISVTTGDHLEKQYTEMDNGAFKVDTIGTTDVIAPGTSGSLAWFRVCGAPEVAYGIDFSGSINIGDGFKASSGLIRDENGDAIEYFPIMLRYVVYDVLEDGTVTKVDSLTSDPLCIKRTDGQGDQHYFAAGAFDNIAELTSLMNSDANIGLNMAFDQPYQGPTIPINRIYALEWEWLYHYDTAEEVAAGKTENNREATASGNYQTRELDTALGEAISKNPESFNITLNMGVAIEQVQGKQYESFTEDGVEKIEFGSYPQSLVEDSALVSTLSTKAGTLPTASNSQNWMSYGYFTDETDENFMWYIDVENDGDKYRGVYFTHPRPCCDEIIPDVTMKYYQSGRGYSTGTVYWFKYDPIVWTILEEASNGTVFILCDMIVDGQAYQDEATSEPSKKWYNTSEGVPSGIYANNYEYSTVRKWLNETFYNTAFSDLQKKFIVTTVVDNRLETTPYTPGGSSEPERYVCNNTRDNIFLLSYQEAENADYNVAHIRSVTEYAKSQGTWADTTTGYGYWKLRSFYCNEAGDYWYNSWHSQSYKNDGTLTFSYVQMNYMGIVPALWIKL